MKQRVHFDIQTDAGHLFKLIGESVPAEGAKKVNGNADPHESICGTVGHEIDDTAFEASFDERHEQNRDGSWKFKFRTPYMVVMRGHVQCSCCGPTCFHCGSGGFSNPLNNPSASSAPPRPAPKTGHGPGAEYCEAVLDLHVLQPIAREASAKLGDKVYAKALQDAATSLGLTAEDIQDHVPYLIGKVADVFAATSSKPSDLFYTAAFLQCLLHPQRGWLRSVHNKLSRDWPQRPSRKITAADVEIK